MEIGKLIRCGSFPAGIPLLLCGVFLAAGVSIGAGLAAQEEASDQKSDGKPLEKELSETVLDVITVTAQRRVQNIMDVPVTVSTVGPELIENSKSILLSDIDKFIPGFDFSDSSMTQAGITMRGISSPNISVGAGPSSVTFYDGMYMPRAAQNVLFSDLERVEVLKGPQGTLFGRNAAVGVVNIVPNQPKDRREGFVTGTWGTDNLRRYEGMANLPVNDTFYLRANFLSNRQDGIVENLARPAWNQGSKIWDLGALDHKAGRLAALWRITPSTDFQVALDIDDLEQAPPMAVGVSEFAYAGGRDPFAKRAENDVRDGEESRDMYGVTAKLNHQFNSQWSAKYLAGFRDWDTTNRQDEDGTADITRYLDTSNNEDSSIFYTELQLNFVNDSINAVGGFSFSEEDVSQQTEVNLTADSVARLTTGELNGLLPPSLALDHIWNADEWAGALTALGFADPIMAAIGMPGMPLSAAVINATGDLTYDLVSQQLGIAEIYGPSFSGQFWQENVFNTGDFTNWGIYADVDFAITERWNVIAGLRYSQDSKDFTWFIPETTFAAVRPGVSNALFQQVDLSASDDWGKLTGRLVTSYKIFENQMLFASYSTGYKSGGFDSLVPIDQSAGQRAFSPEDSENFEVGYKATLWDRVIANLSVFRLELDNLQIAVDSRPPGRAQAVPTIINEDREITGVELELHWRVIDELLVGVVADTQEIDIQTPAFFNSVGRLVPAVKKSFSADTNFTLIADWNPPIAWGNINVHLNYEFIENTQNQQPDLEPFKLAQPAFLKDRKDLDMRISWSNRSERWEIGVWGENVLDERYLKSLKGRTAGVFGTPFGRINRGREVGADLRFSF